MILGHQPCGILILTLYVIIMRCTDTYFAG
jgi:hypothetical protein